MSGDDPLMVRFGDTRISAFDLLEILVIPAAIIAGGWWFILTHTPGILTLVGYGILAIPSLWVVVMLLNAVIALLIAVRNLLAVLLGITLRIDSFGRF